MVFSFFKKQPNKMPERPAARPRPAETPAEPASGAGRPEAPPQAPADAPADPEFAAAAAPAADFVVDDFDQEFTESNVMAIDVDHDVDPLQAGIEQVVVLYANGQDGAARSLLETFIRSYPGHEGQRFWLLLFDLLQLQGDRKAFDALGVDYAEACETSPPTWREALASPASLGAANGLRKVVLQGVLTAEGAQPVSDLAKLIGQQESVVVECGKLAGCDDVVSAQLAELLKQARKARQSVALSGIDAFIERLDGRLTAGDATHEGAWQLLLELLQRYGTEERFEERAVDYAVTFELSPPSWEQRSASPVPAEIAAAEAAQADDAHYLSGDLKGCRFEDLAEVIEASEQPILDFSAVRRLDFVSAGQLVNRLAPYKATGRDILIRSPNLLVAELMAVVGLNRYARIIVPKS